MSWRAVRRGGTLSAPGHRGGTSGSGSFGVGARGSVVGADANVVNGSAMGEDVGGYRTVVIDATEIDVPHVEALVASKRARWLTLERGTNDGWARGAEARERDEERYEEEDANGDQTRRSTEIEASTSASGDGKNGQTMESTNDFATDGSLLQLYHAGVRGTHPFPGSLALPKTPTSALVRGEKLPAVSARAAERESRTLRFTMEVAEIHFEVGALETVEGTMALYDVQTRTKVSENFHFSWPNAKQQKTIAAFTVPAEALTPNLRLIAHLTHLAADEGGIEDKVYTHKDIRKAKVHAEKERQRVLGMEALRQAKEQQVMQARSTQATSVHSSDGSSALAAQEVENLNLSKRRNLLAWAVLPIFDLRVGGAPGANMLLKETSCSEMYRVKEAYSDHALLEAAMSNGTSHSLKSHKPIRCRMICRLNPLNAPSPGAEINGFEFPRGLVHVKELSSFNPRVATGAFDWEMAWGGAIDDGLARELYVYVKSIDIGKRQDLRVRIQLRDDDLEIECKGLLAFPSPCGRGMCRESWTTMSRMRSKGGVFYHEARVRLPVRLNPSHHLVLSIYGAQSAANGMFGSGGGEEALLGHSVINLCSQPETLAAKVASATTPTGGDISLVAMRELLPKYLQSNVRAHMPYWEERKECVHVRLRLASTMHTGDSHIGALFAATSAWRETQTPETEDKLRIAVSELALANVHALIQHLPAVLNLLMSLTLRVSDSSQLDIYEQEEKQSSRLSKDSRRDDDEDDGASLVSAGLSDDFTQSADLLERRLSLIPALPKYERVDATQDIGILAFHTLVRVAAAVQRVEPGKTPPLKGVASHSPPLEAYMTLGFGSLERSWSKQLGKLQTLGTSRAALPAHTILAKRYASVLAETREPYVPYEEALSMSWFFLGMIHRAVALDRAQSPSDTVSIENDEMPLRNVIDILSNEVKTRGERMLPSDADMDQARNLNCGVAMFLTLMFSIPGIKKYQEGSRGNGTLGRAGPLAPLATMLAAMHVKSLGQGGVRHTALLREFFDTLCASPVILDIITASVVYESKNGWSEDSSEPSKYSAGDALVNAFTEAMQWNLESDPERAKTASRIVAATLTRHAWDRSWQSSSARRSIAAAYAPLLRLLISQRETIETLDVVGRRDLLVSILMLARDTQANNLWNWLTEDPVRMKNFVSILSRAAEDFAYETDGNDSWSPSGPVDGTADSELHYDPRVAAGQLNTCVYMIILRLISEWHSRGSLKSQWGVIGAAARAMGVMRRRKVSDPNETVQIPNTRLSPKAYSESSPSSLIDEPIDEDVEYESISFNALEGILSVMLAIMSRPQSESSWKMSAPILDSLLREHCKVLFTSLHPRKINAPLEEYPPSPAIAPGVAPYAFLQGAAIAVFKAAARPPPVRELAVANLRTMLESSVEIFGTSEPLCPTLIYAMHAAFFPLKPVSLQERLSISLQSLKSGTEVSPSGWNNSVKDTLHTLESAELCIRRLANATMNPRSALNLPHAADLEASLALALKSSPAAHVKVLRSLSDRLAAGEHWVEAGEASTAAGIIAMQAFSVAAPNLCVWFEHDVKALRESFFALPEGASPLPAVAGTRCGTEEIGERQVLAHLARAVELFTRGNHLEAALRVMETAQISWQTHRQFDSLSESHATVAELFRRLDATFSVGDPNRYELDVKGKPPPEPATFWRVRLIGSAWDDMVGSEWVYREPRERTLGEMNKKIIAQLSKYLQPDTRVVSMSTNSDAIVEEGCAGLQITALQIDFDALEQTAIGGGVGGKGFSRCGKFTFDAPVVFTETGEVSQAQGPVVAGLRYQGRRRTKITVDEEFPNLLPRSRIINTSVEEMNPCQSAIQMLNEQTFALLAAANARKPQAELLQRLLQGSLAAGVNGGVPSLIQSFFDIDFPSESRQDAHEPRFSTPTPVEPSPKPPKAEVRQSTPRLPIIHRRGLSETAVPMGAGIPLDTPTSASYPSPSPNVKAPPPSPASVATSARTMPTPLSMTTLSPSTPAPPLSRSDCIELIEALWKLYRACGKVFETHRTLQKTEHLEQLFSNAIADLRVSIEAVENSLEFTAGEEEFPSTP